MGEFGLNCIEFGNFGFWRKSQRRGTHVSTLEIGSRGANKCFGGIYGFYADLRREIDWRNLKLEFFGVLLVGPRKLTEEGGQLVLLFCKFGEFNCVKRGFWGKGWL
jgi:hypothetical protein